MIESRVVTEMQNNDLIQEFTKEKKIPVVEIFGPTIQGEGPLAGSKTMFVRFGGCDYRCTKCDSLHAVLPQAVKKHARRMTQQEIFVELQEVMAKTGTRWVTLSGGNPCMWDLAELQSALQASGCYTAVETQGTLCPDWLKRANMVVISPKSPGMGEKFETERFGNFIETLRGRAMMALKVVIFSQIDIDFALHVGELGLEKDAIPRGMRFMSVGNPYPPKMSHSFDAEMNLSHSELVAQLLKEYRLNIEDMVKDPRIEDWKFLPQIHVLVYGNEPGR